MASILQIELTQETQQLHVIVGELKMFQPIYCLKSIMRSQINFVHCLRLAHKYLNECSSYFGQTGLLLALLPNATDAFGKMV